MELVPVEGKPGFYRDEESNAIVNKNSNDYDSYIESRKKLSQDKEKVNSIEDDLKSLKDEMQEIKGLLLKLAK